MSICCRLIGGPQGDNLAFAHTAPCGKETPDVAYVVELASDNPMLVLNGRVPALGLNAVREIIKHVDEYKARKGAVCPG